MTLDHLIPLSKGGNHTSDNLALAHGRCNSRRGAGRIPAQLRLLG
jgi:5-methylcytosine-specific restriction endonuclease McrA